MIISAMSFKHGSTVSPRLSMRLLISSMQTGSISDATGEGGGSQRWVRSLDAQIGKTFYFMNLTPSTGSRDCPCDRTLDFRSRGYACHVPPPQMVLIYTSKSAMCLIGYVKNTDDFVAVANAKHDGYGDTTKQTMLELIFCVVSSTEQK